MRPSGYFICHIWPSEQFEFETPASLKIQTVNAKFQLFMLQPLSPRGVECANGMCAKNKPQTYMCCEQKIRVISCGDLYCCLLPCLAHLLLRLSDCNILVTKEANSLIWMIDMSKRQQKLRKVAILIPCSARASVVCDACLQWYHFNCILK